MDLAPLRIDSFQFLE